MTIINQPSFINDIPICLLVETQKPPRLGDGYDG